MLTGFPRYLKAAIQAISENEYDVHLEYHLAAVIVIGGNIISVGHNSPKANSFIREFGKEYSNMHAECDAILRVRKKIDLTGAKMFVARLTKVQGFIANSKPCDMCTNAAMMYGIKRIIYTVDERTHAIMRL